MLVTVTPGGQIVSKNNSSGSGTIATGSFYPGSYVNISWSRKASGAIKEEARVSAEVRTMLTVGDGLAVYTTIVDFDIHHKPLSKFSFIIPDDVSVADVSTQGLVDWKVEKGEKGKELNVSIAYEAIGRHSVAITYEKILEGETSSELKTSSIVVKDVVHEVGYLAVAVTTNIQVTPKEGSFENLAPLDPSELPADLRGNKDQRVLFGYKYIKHPNGLAMTIVKHDDASVLTCEIENAHYKIMITGSGKELLEGTYRIANKSLQYLTLSLPEGTDLWGVFSNGKAVKAGEKDGKILLPIYQGGLNKTFEMKVLAYRKFGSFFLFGSKNIELPILDVGAHKVFVEVFLPRKYEIFNFGGNLEHTWSSPPSVGEKGKVSSVGLASKVDKITSGEDPWEKGIDDITVDNRNYRRDQSQGLGGSNINLPANAYNPGYATTMARGALAIKFAVNWEGRKYNFTTSILDPNEDTNISFFYSKRARSSIFWLTIFGISLFIGSLATRNLLSRTMELVPKPSRRLYWIALAGLVIIALFYYSQSNAGFLIFSGMLFGVFYRLLRLVIVKIKFDRDNKPEPVTVEEKPLENNVPVDKETGDQEGEEK